MHVCVHVKCMHIGTYWSTPDRVSRTVYIQYIIRRRKGETSTSPKVFTNSSISFFQLLATGTGMASEYKLCHGMYGPYLASKLDH